MTPDHETPRLARFVDPGRDVTALVWLGLPGAALSLLLATPLMGHDLWSDFMLSEFGFFEIATLIMLFTAIVLGVSAILTPRARRVRWLRPLLVLAVLGAVYFAGEEASWGQHYFNFETPEEWRDINSQEEFNFHNLTIEHYGLLDNVPRVGMLLACLILGVILPLIRHWQGDSHYNPEYSVVGWVVPSPALVPVSLMAVLSTVPEKIFDFVYTDPDAIPRETWSAMALYTPAGEFKEFAFAMVFLIGFASLRCRLLAAEP